VDTYQCPVCGGTVTRETGCKRCGQPFDEDLAAWAMYKRTAASLETKRVRNEKERLLLRSQMAHATAQRDALARKIRERANKESSRSPGRSLRSRLGRRSSPPPAPPGISGATPPGIPGTTPPDSPGPAAGATPPGAASDAADPTVGGGPPRRQPGGSGHGAAPTSAAPPDTPAAPPGAHEPTGPTAPPGRTQPSGSRLSAGVGFGAGYPGPGDVDDSASRRTGRGAGYPAADTTSATASGGTATSDSTTAPAGSATTNPAGTATAGSAGSTTPNPAAGATPNPAGGATAAASASAAGPGTTAPTGDDRPDPIGTGELPRRRPAGNRSRPPGGGQGRPRGPGGGLPPGRRPPPIRRQNGIPEAIAARLPGIIGDVPRQGGRSGLGARPPARSPQVRAPKRPRPPVTGEGRLGGAETTTGTAQITVLGLGGLLLAGAVIVLAVLGVGSLEPLGRIAMLTLATAVLLALPIYLARRRLVMTAETVASVGLLMVLLDGYVAWTLGLLGASLMPTQVYFGLVCVATAVIANLYRGASHLMAPRYATVIVLQPVIPLLGYPLIEGPTGWGLALAAVAAIDLGLGLTMIRPGRFAELAGFVRPTHLIHRHAPAEDQKPLVRPESAPEEPDAIVVGTIDGHPVTTAESQVDEQLSREPEPYALETPAFLRTLTWVLFTVAFATAVAFSASGLITAGTPGSAVRAAVALLLSAGIGLAGSLVWRQRPMPDIAGGIAMLAVVLAVLRVGSVTMPNHTLFFAALAVALAAIVVPVLPVEARRGPSLASSAAAAGAGLYLLVKAVPAIFAPIIAARPLWNADLGGFNEQVAAAAGPAGWQLVVAGALLTFAVSIALPERVRTDAALAGVVLTLLTLPAALHFNWVQTPSAMVIAAIAVGAAGLTAVSVRAANAYVVAAGVLGGYATLTGLTRPGTTALVLAALTLGGFVISMLRPVRSDPAAELAGQQVGDWAAGGAAFALTGAVCTGLVALIEQQVFPGRGASFVLAGGFVAVSATLAYVAILQVAGRRRSTPLLTGTTLSAFAVTIAALIGHSTTIADMGVAALLLASAVLLWMAPSMDDRYIFGQVLTGNDTAAAAVTASATAAMARVLSLAMPGFGLVTTAGLVLAVAVAVRGMPAEWRRGPTAGEIVIGTVIAAVTGAAALGGAAGVVHAANPLWNADLGPAWTRTAQQWAAFGWQAPMALLLVAAAAVVVVPRPLGDDIAAISIGLAALGAPAGFGLPWWSPMVIGLLGTIGLGVAAALADHPRTAYIRAGTAGVLALFTTAASLVRAPATSAALESLAIAAAIVALLAGIRLAAARTPQERTARYHLIPVGGSASAAAILAVAGAAGSFAAGERMGTDVVLAGALAGTSLALALAGLLCWRMPGFMPYVTGAVAISGSAIALAALPTGLPVGLYAATATLLGVLAELLRVNAIRRVGWRPEDGWRPAGGWSPKRGGVPPQAWQPAGEGRFGVGALAASAVPAIIAVAAVSGALAAALFGPYHFALHPWSYTATESASLHPFSAWAADATDVFAMATLTFAAALAAVGLGGSRQLVANRAVSVAVPGAGLTMLLIPAALQQGQLQSTFALLVATLCGLSLALTTPPEPDSIEGQHLRVARRLVFFLAVLAAVAGVTGALATRSMTIETFAGSVVVGWIGAWWGKYPLARMVGWHVAAGAAELLALTACLAAGWTPGTTAFPVLGVCAIVIAFAAFLPRIRPTNSTEREVQVLEGTAYLGIGAAVVLTYGEPKFTALAGMAIGAILGLAASRAGRPDKYRQVLLITAAASEVAAVWLLMSLGDIGLPEAYSVPFALFALFVGVLELRRHPEMRSWLAYGPALVAGFLPSLVLVLTTDTTPLRRVLVIVAGVLTVAIGSLRREQAPVVVGTIVTATATLHELSRLGAVLPWSVLLILFLSTGALLVALGATYEKRRQNMARLRGAVARMR
jgi:hypothetical protein